MATPTDVQESAQALFCALANRVGTAGLSKFFDKEKFPTYLDFKTNWNKTFKNLSVEAAFKAHVKSGKASLSEIEDLLHGVKEKGKKKNEWYYSSLEIAKKLIQEIAKISAKFSYVKAGNWQDVFWRHGDKEVMENMSKLFKKANDYQKELVKNNKDGAKIPRPFDNINKWTTADIYFASETAKREIEEAVKLKKLDYTKLNALVSKQITEGILLPLSLKKQPNEVTIKKVNFNRPKEQAEIDKLQFGGVSEWKPFDKKKMDINNYTRTLMVYLSKDKSMELQMRHDPSSEGYKGVVKIVGAGAFEGSLSAGPIYHILKTIDPSFSEKWFKTYNDANELFREQKGVLDDEIKDKDRKRYDKEREEYSAEVTNKINPLLIDWLKKNKEGADLFVRSIYTYATARSTNSAKYVIAK